MLSLNDTQAAGLSQVDALLKALIAPSWQFWVDRRAAAESLGALGPMSRPALGRLARALVTDGRPIVERAAAGAMFLILFPDLFPASWRRREPVSWAEADQDIREARTRIEGLYVARQPDACIDEAIPFLRQALQGRRGFVRTQAAMLLGLIGRGATCVLEDLQNMQALDREPAVWQRFAMANISRVDNGTVEYLGRMIADSTAPMLVRKDASSALMMLYGVDRRPAIPYLVDAVAARLPSISHNAVVILHWVMSSAESSSPYVARVVHALVSVLDSDELAGQASGALVAIGAAGVPYLIEELRAETSRLKRLYVARALGQIGPAANAALSLLRELDASIDDSDHVVAAAIRNIERLLEPSPAVPRVRCDKCGAAILPTTAKATEGLCRPCAKGKRR